MSTVSIDIELHLPVGTCAGSILGIIRTALSVAEDEGQIDPVEFDLATDFVDILEASL